MISIMAGLFMTHTDLSLKSTKELRSNLKGLK